MTLVQNIQNALLQYSTPERSKSSQRFFKTGAGQYGEGDIFIGVTVPEQRRIAKQYAHDATLEDIQELLQSKEHEFRLVALMIMTYHYPKASDDYKKELYDFYLSHIQWINNWDLVDSSAGYIVGMYLSHADISALERLAQSSSLWERRIAIIATFAFIKQGYAEPTFAIARLLLRDKHDLIHKAVGWMLREVGKRCGEDVERVFLDQHVTQMPRTMLRYAIERFPKETKAYYMQLK